MKEPTWVEPDVAKAIRIRQIKEHGGVHGIRDASLLKSALGAPKNFFLYENASLIELAARYVHLLAPNHLFADGNKRTAYVCMPLFLKLNGLDIAATDEEKIGLMMRVAEGSAGFEAIVAWLEHRVGI